jgi:hypothetical protein
LACVQIGRRVVVVGARRTKGEVVEVGVDPGDGREVALRRPLEEAAVPEDIALVEVGRDAFDLEAVFGIDQPEDRDVVV